MVKKDEPLVFRQIRANAARQREAQRKAEVKQAELEAAERAEQVRARKAKAEKAEQQARLTRAAERVAEIEQRIKAEEDAERAQYEAALDYQKARAFDELVRRQQQEIYRPVWERYFGR